MKWDVCLGALFASASFTGLAQQPVDFPHDKHVAAALECIDCHIGVESQAAAGIPSVRKCMFCHSMIAVDKPGVKLLRQYWDRRREIPWVRVFAFEPSAQVKFHHAAHLRAKVDCKICHGDVASMGVARPVVKHTMGTCITCHRQSNATTDCVACHL